MESQKNTDADKFSIYLIVGTSNGSNVLSSLRSIGTEIRPKDGIENSKWVNVLQANLKKKKIIL